MKHSRPDGVDPHARSRARRRALQAVYAWQLSGTSIPMLIAQFEREQDMEIADQEYFEALVIGVAEHRAALDEVLSRYLDRTIEQVDPIERAVLRIAAYELIHRIDRETSGILLIARKRSALTAMHDAMRAGHVRKRYLALALGDRSVSAWMMVSVASTPTSATSSWVSMSSSSSSSISLAPMSRVAMPWLKDWRVRASPDFMRLRKPPPDASGCCSGLCAGACSVVMVTSERHSGRAHGEPRGMRYATTLVNGPERGFVNLSPEMSAADGPAVAGGVVLGREPCRRARSVNALI